MCSDGDSTPFRIGCRHREGQRLADSHCLEAWLVGKDWRPILCHAYEQGCMHVGPVSVFGRQVDGEDSGGRICMGGRATIVVGRTVAVVPAERDWTRTSAGCRCEGHRLTGRWSGGAGNAADTFGK